MKIIKASNKEKLFGYRVCEYTESSATKVQTAKNAEVEFKLTTNCEKESHKPGVGYMREARGPTTLKLSLNRTKNSLEDVLRILPRIHTPTHIAEAIDLATNRYFYIVEFRNSNEAADVFVKFLENKHLRETTKVVLQSNCMF